MVVPSIQEHEADEMEQRKFPFISLYPANKPAAIE